MIYTAFAGGCHFGYSFCQNAVRVLYPELDLSELLNPNMDIDDALMQLKKKWGNTYVFLEFIILRRVRCVEDLDGGVLFEVDEVQPANDAPPSV